MEKNYLGFDLDEELRNLEITDEDIAFLLDGMKPSDFTSKMCDKELNKIIEQNMKQRVAPTNDVKHMATRGTEFDYIAEKQNEQQISME